MAMRWAGVIDAKAYQVQWRERGGKWKTKAVKSAKTTEVVVKGMEKVTLTGYLSLQVEGAYLPSTFHSRQFALRGFI